MFSYRFSDDVLCVREFPGVVMVCGAPGRVCPISERLFSPSIWVEVQFIVGCFPASEVVERTLWIWVKPRLKLVSGFLGSVHNSLSRFCLVHDVP